MRRILLGLVAIVGAGSALYVGSTGAFFSDTETSTGNTFAAGAIDLLVDNESYYNGVLNQGTTWEAVNLTIQKFFDFDDVKPADYGEDTISLHVDTNDAYLCAEVTLTSNNDNGLNEPEALVDQTGGVGEGELADAVNFVWWADDGDNVLEVGEDVISSGPIGALELNQPFAFALADSETNIWDDTPGPVDGDTTYYIGKAWCFGAIGTAPVAQDGSGSLMSPAGDNNGNQTAGEPEDGGITCDGANLGNETQTDSLTADVSFDAVQARNNPNFLCVEEEVPQFGECTDPNLRWADAAGLFDQGRRKDGGAVLANRSVPSAAFGPAQTTGTPSDVGFPAGSFVSLGFDTATTATRSLVLSFTNNVVLDGPGADLRVFEVTGGAYPDEIIKVEVSQDGTNWLVASSSAVRDASVDISPTGLAWVSYVRVTDVSNKALFPNDGDGYDVDAIEALHCGVLQEEEPVGPTTATLTLVKVVDDDETVDGDEQSAGAWTLSASGPTPISGATGAGAVTNAVVTPGVYNLSESVIAGYTGSAWVCNDGVQNDSDTVTLAAGDNATCTITNTEDPEPVNTTPLSDNFGTGACLQDIPGWDEDAGESCPNGTVAAATSTGDNTVSPDGGRFALLGNGGYICRSIDATGLQNLQLQYYWRGDSDAEAGDVGRSRIYTGGTCAAPTGLVASSTHAMTSTTWSALHTLNLPASVNNTTFLLKFTADTNNGNESFRIDGVSIVGDSI